MSKAGASFSSHLFRFLRDLRQNNNRQWFQDNKRRYEDEVKDPALSFISDFGPRLRKISPHYRADPRPVGGSLFRIYRDVRFSKDKSPYKTAVGIQFRHKQARDVHTPGFYLHLEPDECFAGLGIWHPDGAALAKVRAFLAADPASWGRTIGARGFRDRFEFGGESLKRPPKGFDPDHPLIEDLKRKDFIVVTPIDEATVTAAGFIDGFESLCRTGAPFVRYLCAALGIPF